MSLSNTRGCQQLAVPSEFANAQHAPMAPKEVVKPSKRMNPAPTYIKLLPKINPTISPVQKSTIVEYTPQLIGQNGNWMHENILNNNNKHLVATTNSCSILSVVQEATSMVFSSAEIATVVSIPESAVATAQGVSNNIVANPVINGTTHLDINSTSVKIPKPRMRQKRLQQSSPIHLFKSGNTYHSLENLDEEKMKVITNALKSIGDPLSSKRKSVYDGTTKTRIKYRVVYPKDFDISETSQIIIKDTNMKEQNTQQQIQGIHKTNTQEANTQEDHTNEQQGTKDTSDSVLSNSKFTKKTKYMEERHVQDEKELTGQKMKSALCKANLASTAIKKKVKRKQVAKKEIQDNVEKEAVVKVTRSGRTVKSPKGRNLDDAPKSQRIRKQSFVDVLTCLRCHERFHGAAKINRHYEIYPTHKPNNTHSNLFQCFLDIMKMSAPSERGYAFIEQLEELIVKIRNMLPCMINNIDSNGGKLCCINEDLGKMLDMPPGKYNISFDEALRCYDNNRREKCKNLLKGNNLSCSTSDLNKPSQLWVAKHNEEIALMSTEEQDCARTHSVDKWPAIKKRIKKYIPVITRTENNQKVYQNIDVTTNNNCNEETVQNNNANSQTTNVWLVQNESKIENNNTSVFNVPSSIQLPLLNIDGQQMNVISLQTPITSKENTVVPADLNESSKVKNNLHFNKYHSTHFNIRSSPMKSSNTSFNQIQIKENVPVFVKFASAETLPTAGLNVTTQKSDVSNMQHDLTGMFTELNNRTFSQPLNKAMPHSIIRQQPNSGELYNNSDRLEALSLSNLAVDTNQSEYTPASSNSSAAFCDISQSPTRQNDHLLLSENAPISQNTCLLSSGNAHINHNLSNVSTAHLNHNDRIISDGSTEMSQKNSSLRSVNDKRSPNILLSGGNTHLSQNDRLISNGSAEIIQNHLHSSRNGHVRQNDYLLSTENAQMSPTNHLLSSENAHRSQTNSMLACGSTTQNQNDRLIYNGSTEMSGEGLQPSRNNLSKNDYLLSSGNSQMNQSDHLLSSGNTHRSQNDRLLSSGNTHMPQNDRLLSSGNTQMPQNDRLLSSGNVEMPQNDSLVNLCVNETNLEGSRMGMQLLDHLGGDCLSFTDTELRGTSLDLPLDLFQFNHTE